MCSHPIAVYLHLFKKFHWHYTTYPGTVKPVLKLSSSHSSSTSFLFHVVCKIIIPIIIPNDFVTIRRRGSVVTDPRPRKTVGEGGDINRTGGPDRTGGPADPRTRGPDRPDRRTRGPDRQTGGPADSRTKTLEK
jgi:hypothetical protein